MWVVLLVLLASLVGNVVLYLWLQQQKEISRQLELQSEEHKALLEDSRRERELVKPPATLVVMRHATRMDDEDKNWAKTAERVYDPPATNLEFAMVIAEEIRHLNIKKIVTSPFIRCVQTAAAVAQCLKINQLHINHTVAEMMTERHVSTRPRFLNISELQPFIKQAAPDVFISINEKDSDFSPVTWPESQLQARTRFKKSLTRLAQQARESTLVVSHGDAVASFVAMTQSKDDDDIYQTDYFAFAQAEVVALARGVVGWREASNSEGVLCL
eukprot:c2837_g1_i1.p1 GENE.c2837_g1_i1~~c2837_g1_i1.p1  ORF type:complete len:284 (+),score=96.70 c2837_g1_i1:39-854(+)